MGEEVKDTLKEDGAAIAIVGYEIRIVAKPTQVEVYSIETAMSRLSEHLGDLGIKKEPKGITIKPVGYLCQDKLASIANITREISGNHISSGKKSRFLIPRC